MKWINQVGVVTCIGFLASGLIATPQPQMATVTVDCDKGGASGSIGSVVGRRGIKDVSDKSCIDRSAP